MSEDIIPFGWRARGAPLVASAAAGLGPVARVLATRLLAHDPSSLAKLRGVAASRVSVIVVLGDTADLPWVDGVVYLGRDPRAPSLLVPTLLEPDVPIELVERALLRRMRDGGASDHRSPPLAVFPESPAVVPCGSALPLVRARLVEALRAA